MPQTGGREMYEDVITKPVYQVLSELTQETKLEVALPLAIKDWVKLAVQRSRLTGACIHALLP